ncbi:MAG: CBS domain-containing protein [Sulfurimonas sp.]|nr:CBS domain-containing protein [Sulfurimonas sp.]
MMKIEQYLISKNESIQDALLKIENNHSGIVFIHDKQKIIGSSTDGDIRRILLLEKNLNLKIETCIFKDFVYLFDKDASRENILKLLDTRIKIIPILNENYELVSVVSHKNINWNEKEKIISKAKSPVRISFAGGGTDLTTYFYKECGVVLNTTINKFSHAILQKRADNTIKIFSNDLDEEVNYSDISELQFDGKLDLIKSVIKLLNPDFGFELYTYSDVPVGSGLGGSAVQLSRNHRVF